MEKTGDLCEILGEVQFEWRIKDVHMLSAEVDSRYKSPEFYCSGASWEIWIYPNGETKHKSEGWIDLYVNRKSGDAPVTVDYSLSLKTVDGKTDFDVTFTRVFDKKGVGRGRRKFIQRSELIERKSELLPSGILTVICSLKKSGKRNVDALGSAVPSYTLTLSGIKTLSDLKELFLKQEDCDVTLKVKEQEFPAHRAILTARSPVFASTFRNDMKEKATGVIDIEDCDPSSFSDFLCFLYCGNAENLSTENVFSLFTTADKYDVQDLRSECMEFIKNNLSVDTFCNTTTLALQHSEKELIELTASFLAKNLQEIIVTVEWQSLLLENPIQCNELMIKAFVSKKQIS